MSQLQEDGRTAPSSPRQSPWLWIAGISVLTSGLVTCGLIFAAAYGVTPFFFRLGLSLGMPIATMLSALGQILIVSGIGILWTLILQRRGNRSSKTTSGRS